MTAPSLRHHSWCTDPTVRQSDVPMDRLRTRYRCLGCGVEATVTGGHHIRCWADADGYSAACTCGWRSCRRNRDLRDRDADSHQLEADR